MGQLPKSADIGTKRGRNITKMNRAETCINDLIYFAPIPVRQGDCCLFMRLSRLKGKNGS